MTTGIRLVTGITSDVHAKVDFCVGFFGLGLMKRTGPLWVSRGVGSGAWDSLDLKMGR
jgi:hypothetical protein